LGVRFEVAEKRSWGDPKYQKEGESHYSVKGHGRSTDFNEAQSQPRIEGDLNCHF
jgi:hypothetical protein